MKASSEPRKHEGHEGKAMEHEGLQFEILRTTKEITFDEETRQSEHGKLLPGNVGSIVLVLLPFAFFYFPS
jgi:hypothetical protein